MALRSGLAAPGYEPRPGSGGSAYNPSKEEVEELALREKLAKSGAQSFMPKNLLDMSIAERLEVLRKIASQGPGGPGAQLKRETGPFGNVMRLGF